MYDNLELVTQIALRYEKLSKEDRAQASTWEMRDRAYKLSVLRYKTVMLSLFTIFISLFSFSIWIITFVVIVAFIVIIFGPKYRRNKLKNDSVWYQNLISELVSERVRKRYNL